MAPGDALLGALEEGSIASAMRDSLWMYPLVETIHIIGFSILVGAVVMFDLRILGASRYACWLGTCCPGRSQPCC
jgi:hypothetical protein